MKKETASTQTENPETVRQPLTDSRTYREEKTVYRDKYVRHGEPGNYLLGILVIFVGITLFFNNFGLIPWQVWDYLWHFWPVLLILAGFRTLLGKNIVSNFLMGILILAALFFVWNKVLIDLDSPLVLHWQLHTLPWHSFLQQLQINYQ